MLKRIFPAHASPDGRTPMEELHKLTRDVPYGYWTILAGAFSAARRRSAKAKPQPGLARPA
jgi:hypothetical protein